MGKKLKAAQVREQIRQARQLVEKPLPPDPEEMNNQRARMAAIALAAFADEAGLTDSRDNIECALGDLLCDLMHWCDRQPLADHYDFQTMLQHALRHYAEETSHG
jgi:hypothetical protein